MSKIRMQPKKKFMEIYLDEKLQGVIPSNEYYSIVLVMLRELFKTHEDSLKLSDEFLVYNLDYDNRDYPKPTREECLVMLETIGDTILKQCHYVRQNKDVNTLATLKNLVLSITDELDRIGEELE